MIHLRDSKSFKPRYRVWVSSANSACDQTVETKTNTAPDGGLWEEVDTAATISAHPKESSIIHQAIVTYVTGFSTADSSNARHARAIQACQFMQSRLLGDSTC